MRANVMFPWMLLSCLAFGGSALAQDYDCPKADHKATPEQVFAARIEAMQRGDMQAIACSYSEDAVVVFPGSVVRGRVEIMKAFLAFASAFGGAPPTVTSVTSSEDVLFVTYTLVTPGASVPDGSDTFVIRKGRVEYQTVHASMVFAQP